MAPPIKGYVDCTLLSVGLETPRLHFTEFLPPIGGNMYKFVWN